MMTMADKLAKLKQKHDNVPHLVVKKPCRACAQIRNLEKRLLHATFGAEGTI